MTKRFISYGSIGQLRNVVKDLQHVVDVHMMPMPDVCVDITEKVHGTNAAVCFNSHDQLWVQSRNNIITADADNAGCAQFVKDNREAWIGLIMVQMLKYDIDIDTKTIVVYFEWSGGNIQKNSALSGLSKRAILFDHFKVVDIDGSPDEHGYEPCSWYKNSIASPESDIHLIPETARFKLDLNFSKPAEINNTLRELVNRLEDNSPLGNSFGVENNICEGVVVTFEHMDKFFRFKVKGKKHSATKVKTLSLADTAKEQVKIDFVNRVCTASRLEQAWQTVFGIGNEKAVPDVKMTGDFIRAVSQDVIKEESDVLIDIGLTMKDVGSLLSRQARQWFTSKLNDEVFVK
jgi:hypothetical protein